MSETATATRSHKWRKEQLTEPVQTEWGGLPVIIHERWVAQAWGFTLTLTREERLLWEDVRGGWYLTVEGGDLECAMTEEVGSFHWDARRATTSEFARKRVSWCKNQWRKNQSAPKTCTDCLQPMTPERCLLLLLLIPPAGWRVDSTPASPPEPHPDDRGNPMLSCLFGEVAG